MVVSALAPDIDPATMSRLAGQAMGQAGQPGAWTTESIRAGDGEGLGVYRYAGQGRDAAGAPVRWSLILKLFPRPTEMEPQWNVTRREAAAYASGALADLPGGLAAPRCLGVEQQPDGAMRLWLAEVADDRPGRWPMDRYALAARHLGQFNGAYLTGRPRPQDGWVSRGWLRSWVAAAAPAITQLAEHGNHPLVRAVYPPDSLHRLLVLWDRREAALAKLAEQTQTFCHHDAFRRNLLAHNTEAGEQTVAIDWAFCGDGAAGEDIVPLAAASLAFFEVDLAAARALEDQVLTGYLDGLSEAGWRGEPDAVRYVFLIGCALRYALGTTRLTLPILFDARRRARVEELHARSLAEITQHWCALGEHLLDLADDADRLIGGKSL